MLFNGGQYEMQKLITLNEMRQIIIYSEAGTMGNGAAVAYFKYIPRIIDESHKKPARKAVSKLIQTG
jgi:hypothetical protein